MRILPLDFGRLLWRERGVIAFPALIGTVFWAGYYLTQTPLASLSIWRLAAFGLVGAIALKVVCSTSTGNSEGSERETVIMGGNGSAGGDDGHC